MRLDRYIAILEKQEELLQFSHFTRKDAWDLGNIFVSEIFEKNYPLTCSIRLNNGLIVFQYAPEGTNPDNNYWMTRKTNLVRDKDASSLLTTLRWKKKGETLAGQGLDPTEYVACGGGFPIRVRGAGSVGAALVSGLPHLQDHDILVTCISRYLHIDDAPRIPLNARDLR
jgi:uncharacterized protein (UPF0303 family)